jgi:hypothetical protein
MCRYDEQASAIYSLSLEVGGVLTPSWQKFKYHKLAQKFF